MVYCCAYGCKSRNERKELGITFHRFPKDKQKASIWVQNMGIKDWTPSPAYRVCSKHFEKSFFYKVEDRVRLLGGAVPTLFSELPVYMPPKKGIKRRATERTSQHDAELHKAGTSTGSTQPKKKAIRSSNQLDEELVSPGTGASTLSIMANHTRPIKSKKCCVPNCSNQPGRRHRLPKRDPEIFDQWIDRIKPENYQKLTKDEMYNRFYICEKHFSPDCFCPGTKRGLMRNAIPTLCILEPLEVSSIPWSENDEVLPEDTICKVEKTSTKNPKASIHLPSSKLTVCQQISGRSELDGDSNIIIDDDPIDLTEDESEAIDEECYIEADGTGQFTFLDESKQDSKPSNKKSRLVSTVNSDLAFRKEMFKYFVNKIIDEITTEEDLNALERMFAHAVPFPNEIQANAKT